MHCPREAVIGCCCALSTRSNPLVMKDGLLTQCNAVQVRGVIEGSVVVAMTRNDLLWLLKGR